MFNLGSWPLPIVFVIFGVAAGVIFIVGKRLTNDADELADETGLGEAIMGAVFLGAATSLPGIITSVTAASGGYAELAISNAVGGIAAQTFFLAIADMFYRKANLEHSAASMENMLQSTLLIALLVLPLLAAMLPEFTLFSIHPITLAMPLLYLYGLRMTRQLRDNPTWEPQRTSDTRIEAEEEEERSDASPRRLWIQLLISAAIVGFAGWVVGRTGIAISERTGLSQSVVGALLTAVATSLPELVTSVAAVRRGALMLAVGGIIGGNAFDTLFVAASDVAYRSGSIYHAINERQIFLIGLSVLLTGFLLMGMIRRERHGLGNIGFESSLITVSYIGAFCLLAFFMN
ncbi:MAG: sodium:calcium antiporter [Oscillochloris sp.]|nr:sodium:calcium antiporter [Oscillochloris sp.]